MGNISFFSILSLFFIAMFAAKLEVSDQNQDRYLSESKSLVDISREKEIVAFGDSLTHGYYVITRWQRHPEFHPYADRLSELLNNQSEIIRAGVSGEFTAQMVRRLPTVLKEHPNTRLCIILGGTNDLGRRVPITTIIDNLKQLHRLALSHADAKAKDTFVYTIAVTIPQASWMIRSPERIQLNKAIRELAGRCSARMALLDMENAFDQTIEANHKYWSPDFLHLSPIGYDAFGEMLHGVMKDFSVNTDRAFSLSCLD